MALLRVLLGLAARGEDFMSQSLIFTILVVLLARFGLLPVVAAYVPASLLAATAIPFDVAPYATSSYLAIGVVAALTLYGLALGGRSLFGDVPFEKETRVAG